MTKHPANLIAETRAEGAAAFAAGKAPAANPYYAETELGVAWSEGFDAARGPQPKLGKLEYPDMIAYGAACIVSKTSKLSDGRFATVGAIYFGGHRGLYVSAVGTSRHAAEKGVMSILDPDPGAAHRSERRLRAMGG